MVCVLKKLACAVVACSFLLVLAPALGKERKMPADGLWSSDKIIDIHAHCGSFAGYDLSEKTLVSNIEKFGVAKVLVSNIDGAQMPGTTGCLSEKKANEECAALVARHPQLLRGLLWCRPNDGNPSDLEKFLTPGGAEPVFVGIKLHPEMNQFNADWPKVDAYMRLCEKHKLPAVVHCGGDDSESAPTKIYALAKRHPTVPIILYHMGFGTDHKSAIAVVKQATTRKDANLYLETSQCSGADAVLAVKQAGAGRVMFGTDATYFGKEHYTRYVQQVDTLKKQLPATDVAKVLRGNAVRVFRLK